MEKTLVDQDSCVFPFEGKLQVNLHFVTHFMTYLMYHIYHFSDIKLFMIIMDIWNTSFLLKSQSTIILVILSSILHVYISHSDN